MANDGAMLNFLESHLEVIRPLSRDCALAWWDNALTGTDESADRAASLTATLRKVYANPDEYKRLKSLSNGGFGDPLLARQHDILLRDFLTEQMPLETIDRLVDLETEVEQEYNNFRADVGGSGMTDNEVRRILRESDDQAMRREAWEASKKLGKRVSERVLQLVRIRNEAARSNGFANYYSQSMALGELDEDRVFGLFDELAAQSDPLWAAWKSAFDETQAARFGIASEDLRPWHYTDQFFQEAPPGELNLDRYFAGKSLEAITREFFSAVGLPIEAVMARSHLYEQPGKNQHAFCTDIDREGDVRVLCNLQPNEHWMGTMLHEFGHAAYDLYSDGELPYLLREPAHTLTTEAIAELLGRFSKDPTWLQLYAGVEPRDASSLDASAREETRVKFLISTRWIITMCSFERGMYRDPDQDLNSLWWDVVEKYQGVRRPDGRDNPDWAAKLHLALAPVYYQNYLLGEMVAAQLLNHLQSHVLAGEPAEYLFTSPKVGVWLKEKVFHQGAKRPWESALEFATGEQLNPAYFAAQLRTL